ncbi:MAG: hypothetical protein FJW23_13385 [Acidimicrobiia bacterium]|nr:hypothetical protein [Acidimicrobiia bacterium]
MTSRLAIPTSSRPQRPCRLRALVAAAALLVAHPAQAQQRPLVTEDPETIGAGRVLLEAGIDTTREVPYPASGLTGNLLRAPVVGVSIGLSSIAELQIDGGFWNRLTITDRRAAPLSAMVTATGDTTSDVEDVVVATKVRVIAEGTGRPGLAFRFATKLPNASNESGLGLDTTDVHAALLLAKTVQSVRVVGNVGLGILGDPARGDAQNDVLLYGLSFARAVSSAAEVVGEVAGRVHTQEGEAPPGTGTQGMFRFGARYTRGLLRLDGGLLVGLTSRDPSLGLTVGFTYVFDAFRVP